MRRTMGGLAILALVCGGLGLGLLQAAEPKAGGAPARTRDPQKILMIGNSLTYTWGIPTILEHLAAAGKRTLTVTAHVAGGKDLAWHWTNQSKPSNQTAAEMIAQGGYDLVILQEYTNTLVKKEGQESFDRMATDYVKAIRAKSMAVMFYMAHPTAKEVDAKQLQPIIEACSKKADELGVPCAPVALAFIRCNEKLPKLALIDQQTDRKYAQNKVATHQSPFGSYLAACTIYAAIYRQSPVGLNFHAAFDAKKEVPIEAADALAAQEIAWEVWQEYSKQHPGDKPVKAAEATSTSARSASSAKAAKPAGPSGG